MWRDIHFLWRENSFFVCENIALLIFLIGLNNSLCLESWVLECLHFLNFKVLDVAPTLILIIPLNFHGMVFGGGLTMTQHVIFVCFFFVVSHIFLTTNFKIHKLESVIIRLVISDFFCILGCFQLLIEKL